jgi:hypothetical protein
VPAAVAAIATLIRPAAWRHFTSGAASSYALTPAAWAELLTASARSTQRIG